MSNEPEITSQGKPITIYSDGGCSPNPGPGGWAAILLRPDAPPQELGGHEPEATNNQMELRAAIEALQALDGPHQIDFYTDSQYLRQGITAWLPTWAASGWQTSQKQAVKNQALWQELAALLPQHRITWHWTKGHAGDRWNERADELASSAIPRPTLPLDDKNAVHIFTAASYSGKTKRGGWCVMLRYRGREKTLSGQVDDASSNRMHIQSAIAGLEALKMVLPVHLYTTASYLKDGATMWLTQWQNRGWQTRDGKPVSNQDLWERLAALTRQYPIHWHVVQKEDLPLEMAQLKTMSAQIARSTGQTGSQ